MNNEIMKVVEYTRIKTYKCNKVSSNCKIYTCFSNLSCRESEDILNNKYISKKVK